MFIKKFFVVYSFIVLILFISYLNLKNNIDINILKSDIVYKNKLNFVKASLKMEEPLFILNIPRINLMEEVYNKYSGLNNVDLHVQILEESDLDKNFLFLAAHSGSGNNSYFNRLVELEIGDLIWVENKNKKNLFVVKEKFYIEKNGYFEYSIENQKGILYLITCSLNNKDKQLVVKSNFVY